MRPRGLFISATDTGVGKTQVAACIAVALRALGLQVGVMKPVETGAVRDRRTRKQAAAAWQGSDTAYLKRAAGCMAELEQINPYAYPEPLAPHEAARLHKEVIRTGRLDRAFTALAAGHWPLIVEGAGGLMVPLNQGMMMIDLAKHWHLPVVLVARVTLGTINHTLLSLEALRRRAIPIAGVVFNAAAPVPRQRWARYAAQRNPQVLAQVSGVPILGSLPHRSAAHTVPAPAWVRRHIDVKKLLRVLGHSRSSV
jgi:dethiobiotin synthetase